MALCSGPLRCVVCASVLLGVAHGARDTEAASSFASLDSEVTGVDKASSDTVVSVGAKGRLIALHMLERKSAAPEATQSEGGDDSAEAPPEPPPEPEVSVQELLEGTPGECQNAKVKKRDTMMSSLGIGRTDYQVQLNDLSKTCKEVATQQKGAKKTMDKLAKLAEKLNVAEVEYQEMLIRLDEEERDIKAKGELIEKLDAVVKTAKDGQ